VWGSLKGQASEQLQQRGKPKQTGKMSGTGKKTHVVTLGMSKSKN